MAAPVRDDVYVLSNCTKHLARDEGRMSEAWRFPIVDCHGEGSGRPSRHDQCDVTFVWQAADDTPPQVAVVGTFRGVVDVHPPVAVRGLYQPVPLRPVLFLGHPTGYFAVTVVVPVREVHVYRFLVNGVPILDPINPQTQTLDDGVTWSRFFTHGCAQPLELERHELAIVERLTRHILPFRTTAGENFLRRHYFQLDKQSRLGTVPHAYRLDQSMGVAHFIDALLASEERHRLIDYRICLYQLTRILAERHPGLAPDVVPRETYIALYEEMARGEVMGWDYTAYHNPRFFLQLLRRHTITGAFAHPKYGGNGAGVAWAFLAGRYRNANGTLFDWEASIESPLGRSAQYLG